MNVNEVIDELSHKHGINFFYDLPDAYEDGDTVGYFDPLDQSIHLTREPSIYTVFHEVGHYLRYKKINPYFRGLFYATNLVWGSGILLGCLLGFRDYIWLSNCIGGLMTGMLSLFVIDKWLNGEKHANNYADNEIQKWLRDESPS